MARGYGGPLVSDGVGGVASNRNYQWRWAQAVVDVVRQEEPGV